jgi:cytochrome c553
MKSRMTMMLTSAALALAVFAGAAIAGETESVMARGGRLYDEWFKENKAAEPAAGHPAYVNKGGEYDNAASWRCKECHGWDYKGKDGAYADGKHKTGVIGIKGAEGKDPAAIAALLRAEPHGYTEAMINQADIEALALWVSKGQVDMDKYIDPKTGIPTGDAAKGEVYFKTICAGCHGQDGKKIKDVSIGKFDNPPEGMHKILNGAAGEAMPALRALDHQVAGDIIAYIVTVLPE